MSISDESTRGVKTLGIRLKPDVHAQLSFIAQLRDGTITDEIQIAITEHIARSKDDPDLRSRADAARAEIEREAAARQQAIATLFATTETPPAAPDAEAEPTERSRPRRNPKGGIESQSES
jgi:hypothetical protein